MLEWLIDVRCIFEDWVELSWVWSGDLRILKTPPFGRFQPLSILTILHIIAEVGYRQGEAPLSIPQLKGLPGGRGEMLTPGGFFEGIEKVGK